MNFEGLVLRYILKGANPLDYHAMLWAGGRWNRQGRYDSLEYCCTIPDWARGKGYWAILSPSAALPGAQNLNIYLSDSPEHLSIKSGKDRFPLNY